MDRSVMHPHERPASRTAMGVAILRALHQIYDGPPKILSDPIVPLLLDEGVLERAADNGQWRQDSTAIAMRSQVVLRSRYAEDCLREAARRGVRQYAMLGAGFDTFAYRQPDWAAGLRIFEVDHAASQRGKIARLRKAGIPLPPNLEFVPADFEAESLREVLEKHSRIDFGAPAFFSCLGVLMYLPESAGREIFRLAASFPERSELVLTFSQGNRDGQSAGFAALQDQVAAVGEPWQTFHDPLVLCRQLSEAGFSRVSVLSPEEAAAAYYGDREDRLAPPRRATIARAIV